MEKPLNAILFCCMGLLLHLNFNHYSRRKRKKLLLACLLGKILKIYSISLKHLVYLEEVLHAFPTWNDISGCPFHTATGKRQMISTYLPDASIVALLFIIIVMAIVLLKIRDVQRRKAIWQIQQSQQQSRRALLLYVMLNHQCSEEVAYQRIATHIKKHVPLDDQSYIDRMLAQDRQSLLDQARDLFFHNSIEIDKI